MLNKPLKLSTDNTPTVANSFPDVHLIVIPHGGPSIPSRDICLKVLIKDNRENSISCDTHQLLDYIKLWEKSI
jgi:hypothetical protein